MKRRWLKRKHREEKIPGGSQVKMRQEGLYKASGTEMVHASSRKVRWKLTEYRKCKLQIQTARSHTMLHNVVL